MDRTGHACTGEDVERAYLASCPFLVSFAARRYRVPAEDAENLAQDLFLGLWQARTPIRNLRAWLIGGMANACRTYWRRQTGQATDTTDFEDWLDPRTAALADGVIDGLLLQDVIQELAPRDAQVLAWHYLDGRTAPEIAAVLRVTPAYATLLIHRCLVRAKAIYRSFDPAIRPGRRGGRPRCAPGRAGPRSEAAARPSTGFPG